MSNWVMSPFEMGTVVLAVAVIVLIICLTSLGNRLKKLRKQYLKMMGQSGVDNLEQVILDLRHTLDQQADDLMNLRNNLSNAEHALRQVKGSVGIHRYNAFGDHGSDMSFSVAIISEEKDGVVLSGLHAREETYMFAKPLNKGASAYTLTPEEQKAINLALQRE